MKSSRQRKAERRAERLERALGPEGFVEYMKARPCDYCGRPPTNEMHHEPPRHRGSWELTVTLCRDCHVRRHWVGERTFWSGRDVAALIARAQAGWHE